jgi:hypothetical protein
MVPPLSIGLRKARVVGLGGAAVGFLVLGAKWVLALGGRR